MIRPGRPQRIAEGHASSAAARRRPLRILLTDGHALAALGVVRSLGRAGHRVVVARSKVLRVAPAAWSRYRAGETWHPNPYYQQAEFRDWLLRQARSGEYDAIVPISEAAIVAVAAERDELSRFACLLIPSAETLRYTLSKYEATRLAQRVGIPIPPTVFMRGTDASLDTRERVSELRFPIVFKTDNHFEEDGAYVQGRTVVVATPNEVDATLAELATVPSAALAQERVGQRGTGAFLLRWAGRTILHFAHRRLHEVPYSGGVSSLRASSRDATTIAAAERLLEAADLDGVAMVEFRELADGSPCFLEINGRLWGSLALALHAGVDFPLGWLESRLYGLTSVRQPDYPEGLLCRDTVPGEVLYLRSVLRGRPDPGAPPPPAKVAALVEFVRLSADPRVRSDTLWPDDPLPWVGALADAGTRIVGGARRGAAPYWHRLRKAKLAAAARRSHDERLRAGGYAVAVEQSILFLCRGNICRSAFAEEYWNRRLRQRGRAGPLAVSAGFFERENRVSPPQCQGPARQLGIDLSHHRSRCVARHLVDAATLICIMDADNAREFLAAFPDAADKLCWLGMFDPSDDPEIADPYLLDPETALRSFARIARSIDALQSHVLGTDGGLGDPADTGRVWTGAS